MQKRALIRSWGFLVAGFLLLLVATIFENIKVQKIYLQKAASSVENTLHKYEASLQEIMADENLIRSTDLLREEEPGLLNKLKNKPYYLFVYRQNNIVFWSTNDLVIRNINLLPDEGNRVINISNGYYEVIRRDYPGGLVALGVIPLYKQYEWENQYLRNGFVFRSTFLKRVKLTLRDDVATSARVYDNKDKYLFSLIADTDKEPAINIFLLILQITGIALLFTAVSFLFGYFFSLVKKKYLILPWLIVFVVLVDLFINKLGLLAFSRYSTLFSDTLFASTLFGKSLGQFLLRCILSLWAILLLNKYINVSLVRWPQSLARYRPMVIVLLASAWYIIVAESIKSMVLNSTINYEFYNFYYLSWFSLIGLAGLGCMLASLYLVFDISFRILKKGRFLLWIPGALVVLAWQMFYNQHVWWLSLLLAVFYLLLAAMAHIRWADRYALFRSLVLVSLLSAMLSSIVVYFSKEKNLMLAGDLAMELLVERSSIDEVGFIDAEMSIWKDNSVKAFMKSPYLNKIDLNERIKSKHLKRYVTKFDIQSYATAADGRPLAGDMPADIEQLIKDKEKLVPTNARSFYYVNNNEGGYIGILPFYGQDSVLTGTLNIRLSQKIFTTYSAYPILFQSNLEVGANQYDKFDFAVYDSSVLIRSKGNASFDHYLDNQSAPGLSVSETDRWEWLQSKNGRTVVVSWKRTKLAFLSLFSYMLFFLLLLFFLLEITGASYTFNKKYPFLQEFMVPSLQRKIQSSMILLVLLSLFMVGLASLLFFGYQYGNYYNVRAARQVKGLSKEIGYLWKAEPDTATTAALEARLLANLQRLSEVSEVDVNFFNTQGELLATTQPEVFLKGLISEKISPEAYYQLGFRRKDLWQNDEFIGKLNYSSVYLRVEAPSGLLLGFLQCPFYEKQRNLKEDISFFLVSFVNFYVLLILFAAIVAVVLSGSITNSLSVIRQHMGTFRIGRKNKPITWQSKDEIGALVGEYNRMINELEKSAEKLAQSEREGAWREMAKQVAHEIKNPLTPMKLGIQHLQMAVAEDRDDLPELTKKIAGSLIEQIDTLAGIATAFADFAKMPKAHDVEVNVGELLQTVVSTFTEENVKISCELPAEKVSVTADRSQLLRVFNNLIKNAIQSIQEKEVDGQINVKIFRFNNHWRISIEDNGLGIPEERREKIFQPNFTTKSSGTGLGLAICKSIIDRIGGKIWLESEEGAGTVFYIELPAK